MSSSSASVKVRRLTTRDPGFEKTLLSSLSIPSADDHAIDQIVLRILERIEREGDAALLQYTQQFDRLAVNRVSDLEITSADLAAAYQSLAQDQA
ncbi:MAG: histidinol dehydrogenase, partial [Betaproteobacteria bacterium]|nr:histidinol dehydrogenase [Betaproteobacteria bacterium]